MSDLERVGDGLGELFDRLGFGKPAHLADLVSSWETIAGPEWAPTTSPVGLEAGTLTIEVASGLDASRLRFAEEALLHRIAERLGDGVVKAIRPRVARRRHPR